MRQGHVHQSIRAGLSGIAILLALSVLPPAGAQEVFSLLDDTPQSGCDSPGDEDTSVPGVQLVQAPPTCGEAGQNCCPDGSCQSGLRCNANGKCRVPCGRRLEKCCNGTCNEGLVCDGGNVCRPNSNPVGGCRSNADCIPPQTCQNIGLGLRQCAVSIPSGCSSDFNCPPGQRCNFGKCIAQPPDEGQPCEFIFQCSGNQVCRLGRCCTADENDPRNVLCPLIGF
jgi:hypothetical protein